ncbi:MAG TPA: HIT domain-containing protein [Candidatus Nanoarchaeia archaeon]|nr:HIT domain-containing protein [Candidatus Nanoarchaeia archaeon]
MEDAKQMTEDQIKLLQEKMKQMSPAELAEFQKQQCLFCKIISGAISSKKIYEDQVCLAVLDIAPASIGHLLIIPREHYSIMPQVPDEVLGHIMVIAKRLSQIMLKALRASGTTVFAANGGAAGQRSQHFVLHLIPRKEGDHVLDFPEKIIPKGLVEKVKAAVEGRLFELIGVKRAVSPASLEADSNASGPKNRSSEQPELALAKSKKASRAKPERKDIILSKRKVNSAKANYPKTKVKSTKKNLTKQKEASTANAEDIKLDDIANLFK